MDKDNVESISEVFECFICTSKLKDARMCPNCSKLTCYDCIRQWFNQQNSRCPYCRSSLHMFELIKCRWIEEVMEQFDAFAVVAAAKSQTKDEEENCETHGEKFIIYCNDCKQCICHKCALWNGVHSGHDIKPLDEIYEQQVEQLRHECERLRSHLLKLSSPCSEGERRSEIFKAIKAFLDEKRFVNDIVFQSKLPKFRNIVSEKMKQMKNLLFFVELKLNSSSKIELMNQSSIMLQTMSALQCQPTTSSSQTDDFQEGMSPIYDSDLFVMRHFSILQQTTTDFVSSPSMNVRGLSWCLRVYPNGNGVAQGQFLSVFLELVAGLPENVRLPYECRVELIHPTLTDPSKTVVRQSVAPFKTGDTRGFKRFYRLDMLVNDGYVTAERDTLILEFKVRPSTYNHKCQEQQWYIHQLQTQVTKLQMTQLVNLAQIDDLKKRFTIAGSRDQDVLGDEYSLDDVAVLNDSLNPQLGSREAVIEGSITSGAGTQSPVQNSPVPVPMSWFQSWKRFLVCVLCSESKQ